MNRRKSHRFHVELRCSFLTDRFTGEGTALDLSMEGCRMHCDVPLVKGQYVEVFINLLGEIAPLAVELAVIRWSGEAAAGIEFIRIAERHQSRLRHYLTNLKEVLMPCGITEDDEAG